MQGVINHKNNAQSDNEAWLDSANNVLETFLDKTDQSFELFRVAIVTKI